MEGERRMGVVAYGLLDVRDGMDGMAFLTRCRVPVVWLWFVVRSGFRVARGSWLICRGERLSAPHGERHGGACQRGKGGVGVCTVGEVYVLWCVNGNGMSVCGLANMISGDVRRRRGCIHIWISTLDGLAEGKCLVRLDCLYELILITVLWREKVEIATSPPAAFFDSLSLLFLLEPIQSLLPLQLLRHKPNTKLRTHHIFSASLRPVWWWRVSEIGAGRREIETGIGPSRPFLISVS